MQVAGPPLAGLMRTNGREAGQRSIESGEREKGRLSRVSPHMVLFGGKYHKKKRAFRLTG